MYSKINGQKKQIYFIDLLQKLYYCKCFSYFVKKKSNSVRRYTRMSIPTCASQDNNRYDKTMNNVIDYDKSKGDSVQIRLTIGCCGHRI
jgi:hypothetical protein